MPSQHTATRRRPRLARLLAVQAAVGVLAAAIAAAIAGAEAALAAGLGGATCFIAQAWFAWRVFGRKAQGDARAMLGAMFRGEAIKLATIVLLLIGIFRLWPEVPPLALVLGFIAVQAVHWFTPLLLEQ